MNIESIEDELRRAFPDSEILVYCEGNLLKLSIKAEQFNSIAEVKRQQMIYSVINHRIKSGEVHAVCISATGLDEREK